MTANATRNPLKAFYIFIHCSMLFALPYVVVAQNTNQPVFNHFALRTTNLKRTADFYERVMQLQVIPNPFKDTVHVWLKIGNGLALHIIQGNYPEVTHDVGIHLCFSVPSIDAFIKHLDAMNISYGNWGGQSKTIQVRTDGVKQIYFKDPDGFWVEVNDDK